MDKILQENLISKYNLIFDGFAFDLDGTLFNEDGKIENNILNKLKEYYKLQLPIIFVTGRGPGTTDEIIISNNLNKHNDIIIINYNGGLIRKIYKGTSEIEIIKEIKNNNGNLDIFINNKILKDKLITEKSGQPFYTKERDYMLTLVFKKSEFKEGKLNFQLINVIKKIIKKNNLKYKVLYTGYTIDLIPLNSGKENAVKFVEDTLGIDKLARVGDKGDKYGNDYDMIAYGNGFTVSEGSTAIPIVNEKGIQLKSQEAIAKIFEILELNGNTKKNGPEIGETELKIYKSIGEEIKMDLLMESIKSGVENIFSFDGSVNFNQKEYNILKDTHPSFLKYIAEYGGQYYSRNNYFHLNEDNFLKKYNLFFENFTIIKNDFEKIINNSFQNKILNRKMLLAITDLFKNYIIKYLHYYSYLQTIFDIKLSNKLDKIKKELLIIEKLYINILEDNFTLNQLKELNFEKDFKINKLNEKICKNIRNNKMFEKSIRETPEANHPYFNYIYSKKVAKKIIKEYKNEEELILIGLHYGGIELPYLLEVELNKMGFKGNIIKIGAHYSNYSNSLLNGKSNIFDEKINVKGKTCIVQDDGGFTGKSLFKIGDNLLKKGAKKIEYSTVHFSGDRARNFLQSNGGLSFNFLEYLKEWGIVRIGPFYKKGIKINIEKQRVKKIIK